MGTLRFPDNSAQIVLSNVMNYGQQTVMSKKLGYLWHLLARVLPGLSAACDKIQLKFSYVLFVLCDLIWPKHFFFLCI